MKLVIRSLVIALAVSGAIATSFAKAPTSGSTITVSKTSAMPVPRCAPGGADGCGLDSW